jgi:hypothetical protein
MQIWFSQPKWRQRKPREAEDHGVKARALVQPPRAAAMIKRSGTRHEAWMASQNCTASQLATRGRCGLRMFGRLPSKMA